MDLPKFDTIIIGAGLSGLAAGIRLAYFEKSVCVLERHTTIGGLNSFYRLRGRDHDVGLHAVTNYASPGTKTGALSKLLRQLRLRWDDFDLTPQCESSIAFPDCRLRFTNDFEFLQQEVAEKFPDQRDGFQTLVQRILEYDELRLDVEPISTRNVLGTLITDPLLIEMLLCPLMFYGSPTSADMDFTQFVIMFKSVFCEGFSRPREGIRRILRTLVRKYKSLGGELRLRAGVQRILTDHGRAVGVQLDDGSTLEADNVLSSAGVAETLALCDAPSDVRSQHPASDISFVEGLFSLDRQPNDFGHKETIVFFNDSSQFRYERPESPVDLRSGVICCPNNFVYDEPLDEGIIRLTGLADPDFWRQSPQDEYVQSKNEWCERMKESAVRFVPDFREYIVDTDMFTPRTIERFTGHFNGAVYGAADKIRDGRTHLDGLYLCGTDQGYLGIVGSMLSGITVTNLHLLRD